MGDEIEGLRLRARLQVQKEVDLLPLECKKAYLEAREAAPVLCETESDPLHFLRRCDYNVEAAAKRLCLYWTKRKDLFQERAFFPLILTGDGALTKDDVLSFKAGWPAILPDTVTGQKVVLLDRRQYHPVSTRESRLRGTFYLAKLMAEDELTQTEKGVLLFTLISVPRASEIDPLFSDVALRLAREVFPVRCFFHLINQTQPTGGAEKRYEVQDRIGATIDRHMGSGSKLDDLEVHFERGSGEEELLAELLDLGLTHEGIPSCLGGSWSFVKHTEWCQEQARAERSEYAKPAAAAAASKKGGGGDAEGKKPKKSLEARQQRRRELNVIYSRRKRERRQQETQDLQDERDQLAAEQEYLLDEQKRLENLLAQAAKEVERQEKEREKDD